MEQNYCPRVALPDCCKIKHMSLNILYRGSQTKSLWHSFWIAPLHALFWAKKKPHVLKICKSRAILQKYKLQMQIPSFCASQHASPEADLVCKCPKLTVVILDGYISWYHKNFLANISSNIAKRADNLCLRQLLGIWSLILELLWVI